MATENSPTVCFDFDGVIHSFKNGWTGLTCIADPPVDGIKEVIDILRNDGYKVIILSTRAKTAIGIAAIRSWLTKHNITVDLITDKKPPAVCYVDDRAICFDGTAAGLVERIENFKPWNR